MHALSNLGAQVNTFLFNMLFLFGNETTVAGGVKGGAKDSSNSAWNIFNMFDSMRMDGETLVGYLAGFLAVILFGFAAFKFAQAVMSQQGRGANVGVAIAALVVGGFLGFDAYNRIAGLSKGAGTTIENWGTGTTNSGGSTP